VLLLQIIYQAEPIRVPHVKQETKRGGKWSGHVICHGRSKLVGFLVHHLADDPIQTLQTYGKEKEFD
jgi:hypothetical protein